MAPPLETPLRNQRQTERDDRFLEIIIFLGRKIDKTGTDLIEDLFPSLEKIFPLSIFNCDSMAPFLQKSLVCH